MISFQLNGQPARFDEHLRDTPLVYVLRDDTLREMTPRLGCGREQCGACRVLVDGSPEYACTLPAGAVADRHVETSAGMDGTVRRALVDANATQCGYCLPGIIVAAEALFRSDPHPTRARIAEALDTHLCRCGSQSRVLRALTALAGS